MRQRAGVNILARHPLQMTRPRHAVLYRLSTSSVISLRQVSTKLTTSSCILFDASPTVNIRRRIAMTNMHPSSKPTSSPPDSIESPTASPFVCLRLAFNMPHSTPLIIHVPTCQARLASRPVRSIVGHRRRTGPPTSMPIGGRSSRGTAKSKIFVRRLGHPCSDTSRQR